MTRLQKMCEAGRKCANEYPHRATGGQAFDDLPIAALDKKTGKPTTTLALNLVAAWLVGFHGGSVPRGARMQRSVHGAGKESVQVFLRGRLVGDYNV